MAVLHCWARQKAHSAHPFVDVAEGTIYPEEIGHCAAGVRWLTHLHAYAHARGEGTLDSKGADLPSNGGSAASNHSGRAPGSSGDGFVVRDSEGIRICSQGNGSTGLEASLAGIAVQQPPLQTSSARLDEQDADWEAEACKHPTVQAWFHR